MGLELAPFQPWRSRRMVGTQPSRICNDGWFQEMKQPADRLQPDGDADASYRLSCAVARPRIPLAIFSKNNLRDTAVSLWINLRESARIAPPKKKELGSERED